MKILKFRNNLVQDVLSGSKRSTWRIFDDKDLSVGDDLELIEKESGEKFAEAEIISVREKTFGEIEESDFEGHEEYSSPEAMLQQYQEYYGDKVTMGTLIKMIDFKVTKAFR